MTITQTVNLYNTRLEVDWLTEGMNVMYFTLSDMPDNMDQKGGGETMMKYNLSSVRPTHKTDFTVTDIPGNMDQNGEGVTKRKYDQYKDWVHYDDWLAVNAWAILLQEFMGPYYNRTPRKIKPQKKRGSTFFFQG